MADPRNNYNVETTEKPASRPESPESVNTSNDSNTPESEKKRNADEETAA
jgi:hypothetical protein